MLLLAHSILQKEKENFTLVSHHNGSLLRVHPGAIVSCTQPTLSQSYTHVSLTDLTAGYKLTRTFR